jgi:riboflavin kinase / FMN adenylyltransferase
MFLPTNALSLGINDTFPAELRGSSVSVGNFDGVHLGHAALIAELRQEANRLSVPAVAVTFDPHPLRLLAPDRFMPQLTTPEDRAELLLKAGADWVVILKTTPDLLRLEANEFLQRLFVERFAAKAVVEGFNFGFGRDRGGTTQSLENWCRKQHLPCRIVAAKTAANREPVSSSRVRAALDTGDVAGATQLLGRPYRLRGTVIVGDRRGATIGFPTANLGKMQTVIPGDGVYDVRVECNFGTFAGAMNIGPNPTFGVAARKVEVHLLEFYRDLYGAAIAIDFIKRLRDTRKFASKVELVRQLHEDVDAVRRLSPVISAAHGLKHRIESVLREYVAPALSLDTAGLEVLDVTDGVVRLRLTGNCAGCPATIMTLIMGIEQELRKHIPEVEYLEAVP